MKKIKLFTKKKEVEMNVGFVLTKNLDDFESVKITGGITIPIQINGDSEYEKAYRHWFKIIQKEVISQTYKYATTIKKMKLESLNGK